jgi:Zn-dependent protease
MPRREILALSVAWVVLGVSFSMKYMFERAWWSTPVALAEVVLLTLFIIGTGFLGHELAHKFVAQRYGAWAEFKLWTVGAIMSLVFSAVSAGSFIFAAPGAVYIASRSSYIGDVMDRKTNGIISLVGPMINVAAAGVSGLLLVAASTAGIGTTVSGFNPFIWAIQINLWLGAFNMIPFFILDGQKVLTWNKVLWALIAIPLWTATALSILFLTH